MRVLHVTSPMMVGKDVERAQFRLTHNQYGNFHPGEIDGQFGPQSGAACERAKYWLGYDKSNIKPIYGELLDSFLSGAKTLPATYAARRKYRLWKASQVPQREEAFKIAVGELGTKESPAGSNIVKYSKWYGLTGPWCAMFVSWCYHKAGSKHVDPNAGRWAYTPYMVNDARAGRNGLTALTASEVKRGDIVLFDWDGGVADHVGLFDKWADSTKVAFWTVEGNTAVGNDSNGGEVMRRTRYVSQVEQFARLAD